MVIRRTRFTVVLLRSLLDLADLGTIEGGLIVATIFHVLRFGRIDDVLAFGRPLEVFDIIGFPAPAESLNNDEHKRTRSAAPGRDAAPECLFTLMLQGVAPRLTT